MLSFILWIVMGLLVGAITGFIMKSNYPWYIDLLLGVVGSAVGGWLSSLFFNVDLTGGFDLTTLVVSVIGAVIVVSLFRLVTRRPVR